MKAFNVAFLIPSIALSLNTYAQNTIDNSDNQRQTPTIEDRLAQLQQDQRGLAARVDELSKRLASLQQETKTLEDQSGQSSGNSSKVPNGPPDQASTSNDDFANATNGASAASYDVFYDRLQSDGQWFNDRTYGAVWQPAVASTDQNWRPYTDGRWVYTDRGWTWISNENFGWATYHYGRWARLSDKGWIWVPGSTWAPAWVSWRESDDYVGWAPLPPEAQAQQNVKIEGWADNYYNIGPGSYVFLKVTDLANRSYRSSIIPSQDNVDVISRTRNVTNIYYDNSGITDNGPDYDRLVQNSNVKIDRYRLNFVQQNNPGEQFGAATRGDQLQFVAPAARLERVATLQPKIGGNIAQTQVDRGWQNISEARAKQLKQSWETQAPVPTGLPAKPAPPQPVFARMTRQGQGQNQQPATETRGQNPRSPNQQSNQGSNNESNATPTPSPNEKSGRGGQQPPTPNESRRELRQGELPQTTPPGPPENEKSLQRPERKEASPSKEDQRRQSEGTQQPNGRRDSSQPKTERTPQSDEKRGGGEDFNQQAPAGTNEQKDMPQREEKTGRESKNSEEPPARDEGQQQEGRRNSDKSNSGETERPDSGVKTGQSREQSREEKAGNNKHPERPEQQKVEPSGQ
ncbi:MAG TPA: DUF6600 domain-containing protein [Chthoniobacterales bacterium]|nr:DUF6600 domain-containing protein [Chthoniobacterales bacterium]